MRVQLLFLLLFQCGAAALAAVAGAQPRTSAPLTVLSADGRKSLSTAIVNDHEMTPLDELAAVFQLAVREDSARAITVVYKGKTIVLTPEQGLASVSGRLVNLTAPPARQGTRWFVPLDVINRALALVYDARLELRRDSRLIIVGDLRVPRVVMQYEPARTPARVTFDITPRTGQNVIQQQNRLLIRFDADALDAILAPITPQGLIDSVRLADQTTVELTLGPRFGSFRASTVPSDSGPMRLLIDVTPSGVDTTAAAPAPLPPAEAPPLVSGGPASSIRTIVIDPGHGGQETGAKGQNGALEKDVTLSVARRLKAAIESRLGIRVLLTREGDQDVALDERAAIANNNKADLFVSLHVNSAPRKDIRGAEVFYLSLDGYGEEARKLAANAEGHRLPTFGGGTRDIEVILWEMAQARYLTQSAALAGMMEEELRRRVEMSARPVQQAPFRVLVGANMPAVLIEMAFITNPAQEQQLLSSDFQNAVVQGLAEAMLRFRTSVEQEHTDTSSRVPEPPQTSRWP